jgi:hypothetical protein
MKNRYREEVQMKHKKSSEKESPLVEYLRTPQPMYALLLSGPWGVGKSFYWNQFVEGTLPDLKKSALTISAAGLTNLEEIERALFMVSIKKAPGIITETSGVIGKTILRWAKVAPKDITLKAELKIGKTVVCIDDVERFAGDFDILFGFIVSLVEDAQLHVVLIANEEKTPAKYKEIKEKIVGRTVGIPLDLRSFYKFSIGNVGGVVSHAREALKAFEDEAMEIFEATSLKNLRTVRAITYEMGLILGSVSWPRKRDARISRLFSAVAFHMMAVADNAENSPSVAKAFRQSNIGVVLRFRQISKGRPGNGVSDEGGRDDADTMDKLYGLVERFARPNDPSRWPKSDAFVSFVLGASFDPEAIVSDFDVFQKDTEKASAIFRLQERQAMSMTEETFASTIEELVSDIEHCRFKYAMEIFISFDYLYNYSRRHLTRFTSEEAFDFFMKSIERVDTTKIEDTSLHLGSNLEIDEYQRRVLDRIMEINKEVGRRKDVEESKRMLEMILAGKEEKPPHSVMQPYKRGIFDNESPDDFFNRLQSSETDAIERLISFLIKRNQLVDAHYHFSSDKSFAIKFAKKIRKDIKIERPMSVKNSAFLDLAQQFETLVHRIDGAVRVDDGSSEK